MKTKNRSLLLRACSAAIAAAAFAVNPTTHAATFDWDGGSASSNSWTAADNWNPNVAPTFDNTADLNFNSLTRATTGFIANNTTVRSLAFGANIDDVALDGGVDFAVRLIGFPVGPQVSRNLTFEADSGNATVTVDAGATGNINLGANATDTGSIGTFALADNLDVVHNGSGLLLFNRGFTAAAFGITKTGTGTMQTNNFNSLTGALNINGGTLIANTFGADGQDLDSFSAINLGGTSPTLQIGASSGVSKTYDAVPVNVNVASTLEYKNVNASTFTAQFTGSAGFVLNADLAVKNVSTDTTLTNGFNIGRAITGSGDMAITTYNNIASSSDSFGLGRVLLSGDNSAWGGDLTVARGTVSLSGNAVNAAGTGVITIGTASDAFGAGVTFFPTGANGSTVTYENDIVVTAGGFRAIKGGGTDHSVTFNGDITLNGDLTVDHSWGATDRRITLNGSISGAGGLTITRAAGNTGTTARLVGTNTYLGDTVVATGASLVVSGSLTSDITVATGARFGGGRIDDAKPEPGRGGELYLLALEHLRRVGHRDAGQQLRGGEFAGWQPG